MNSGHQVDSVYTDFTKAFDKINHCVLFQKLEAIGITGSLLLWIKSFLANRTQIVKIKSYQSNPFPVTSGVPQGSHLGPFLFLLFINDIHTALSDTNFLIFADDLKIFYKITSLTDCSVLQKTIDKLQNWCITNHLFLNFSKCFIISFSRLTAPIHYCYTMEDKPLTRTKSIQDLGITFDNRLNFKEHIHIIYKRSLRLLGFITRNSYEFRNIHCFIHLYKSLVRPILEYGTEIWNPFYSADTKLLESIQNKFLRKLAFRSGISCDSSSFPSLQIQFNIPKLSCRREYFDIVFIYKLLNNRIDSPFLLSQLSLYVPSHNLKKHKLFFIEHKRTNYLLSSPLHRMMLLVNNIYNELDFQFHSLSKLRSVILCNTQ